MIELPEAVVLAQQVNETLVGKEIAFAQANFSPHKFAWYTGDPAHYAFTLPGLTIQKACAVGNHVEILAGHSMLVVSTPMRFHAPGEKLPNKHQLLLKFHDDSALTCSVQMWGALLCLSPGEQGGLIDYQAALKKPSPLTDAFSPEYFARLMSQGASHLSAKALLATEQRIPGLGNGVLQDILWTARVHPRTRMVDLAPEEIDCLFGSVISVLQKMIDQGGRDTERDLFGNPGGYRTVMSKNTVSTPCPACGTFIRKESFLGGSIYYCTSCQPEV